MSILRILLRMALTGIATIILFGDDDVPAFPDIPGPLSDPISLLASLF
ncbi:MAG: hypothetical protein OEZ01_10030 [Candidatus Heimdallarchaeota archaeon]|nr:hypothetical protein [Candidatus Heimdallarchaeota archaeon]